MESSEQLLEQEEAFHKLNAEIELRTRQLMKNVEAVLNKQTSIHWTSSHSEEKYSVNNRIQKRNGISPNFNDGNFSEPLEADSFDNTFGHGGQKLYRLCHTIEDRRAGNKNKGKDQRKKELFVNGLVPSSAKGISAENLVRFLKAKGKLLQEELEHVKRELQTKNEEIKKNHQEIKNRDDEKQRLLGEVGTLRDKVKKIEINSTSQAEKLTMRDTENLVLKKEIEKLKQDLKKLNLSSTGNEAKLSKWREESEKLKLLLKQSESNEKEAREKYRMKSDEMVAVVRKLEKQKSDLMGAIRKQKGLIGNLKKQKEILETETGINHIEKEFLKELESMKGSESNVKEHG